MEVKEFTCIRCPRGCDLRAELEGGEVQRVSGHTCKRGEDYARQEAAHPVRTVTSTAASRTRRPTAWAWACPCAAAWRRATAAR